MLQRAPKKTQDKFAQVPLWWAEQAAQATDTRKAMVWVWLMRLNFETRSKTFSLPNARLLKCGVSRFTKGRALQELEAAGLIRVSRKPGKSPVVTLLYLG
jgi:hypothetical protein